MNTGLLYLPQYSIPEDFGRLRTGGTIKGTQKLSLRERVISTLQQKGEVPALPVTAHRLLAMAQEPNIDLDAVAEIARLDPGITSRILKVASSSGYGGETIPSLQEALSMIGLEKVKKIATTLGVISTFQHMHVKVNWGLFWLHSLLTARLTEILAYAYQEVDGRQYLVGLLHDVGKLFIEHNFPREFEVVMMQAVATHAGMYAVENRILDISHAEAGALLCHKWHLSHEIIGAIQFHHEPISPLNHDPNDPAYSPFLSICLCVADRIANFCHANIQGAEEADGNTIESMLEWSWLQQFRPIRPLTLDVAGELRKTEEIINVVRAADGGHQSA